MLAEQDSSYVSPQDVGQAKGDGIDLRDTSRRQLVQDSGVGRGLGHHSERLQQDIVAAFSAQADDREDPEHEPEEEEEVEEDEEEDREEIDDDPPGQYTDMQEHNAYSSYVERTHPLTVAGRFATTPRTIELPREAMVDPIKALLSSSSNKHISEIAHRELGGPGLPFSPATPLSGYNLPQTPIKLQASQSRMGEIEGDVYLAAVMPGTYAAVTSTLVEVRKRLGSQWLRDLLLRRRGPRVLDAGAAGAGVLAWREVLKAEWQAMRDKRRHLPSETALGSSTIVTGSGALRRRASRFLEDSTFLSRLPDYVHMTDTPPKLNDDKIGLSNDVPRRKQFDVIIAPHTLWPLQHAWQRKFQVNNLWSLLDPDGGVLILLEKGLPRGFEAIAGARQLLLDKHIPGETSSASDAETVADTDVGGMIVAPCTNHAECPMYPAPGGTTLGRRDYCHFSQRYIRPYYLQRILGATTRNHEDVEFSYVAVRKGRDNRVDSGLVQGQTAADASFAGHEENGALERETGRMHRSSAPASSDRLEEKLSQETSPSMEPIAEQDSQEDAQPAREDPRATAPVQMLGLPRVVLPPLKRKGHVIFDVCTPAGRLERWTVPRSFSKQAFRDARKSQWGDLWALGAKTRIGRRIRLGRDLARQNNKASDEDEAEDEDDDEDEDETEDQHEEEDIEQMLGAAGIRRPGQKRPRGGARTKTSKSSEKDEDDAPRDLKGRSKPSTPRETKVERRGSERMVRRVERKKRKAQLALEKGEFHGADVGGDAAAAAAAAATAAGAGAGHPLVVKKRTRNKMSRGRALGRGSKERQERERSLENAMGLE